MCYSRCGNGNYCLKTLGKRTNLPTEDKMAGPNGVYYNYIERFHCKLRHCVIHLDYGVVAFVEGPCDLAFSP